MVRDRSGRSCSSSSGLVNLYPLVWGISAIASFGYLFYFSMTKNLKNLPKKFFLRLLRVAVLGYKSAYVIVTRYSDYDAKAHWN